MRIYRDKFSLDTIVVVVVGCKRYALKVACVCVVGGGGGWLGGGGGGGGLGGGGGERGGAGRYYVPPIAQMTCAMTIPCLANYT